MKLILKIQFFTLILCLFLSSNIFGDSSKMDKDELKNEESFETKNLKDKNLKFLPNLISRDQKKAKGFSSKKLDKLSKVVKSRKYPHPKGKIIFDNDQDEYVVLETRQNITGVINGTVSVVLKNALSEIEIKNLVKNYGFSLILFNEKSKVVVVRIKNGLDLESSLSNLKSDPNVLAADLDVMTGLIKPL